MRLDPIVIKTEVLSELAEGQVFSAHFATWLRTCMNKRFLTFMIIHNFAVYRDLPNLEVNLNFIARFIALVKFNFNYFVIF